MPDKDPITPFAYPIAIAILAIDTACWLIELLLGIELSLPSVRSVGSPV